MPHPIFAMRSVRRNLPGVQCGTSARFRNAEGIPYIVTPPPKETGSRAASRERQADFPSMDEIPFANPLSGPFSIYDTQAESPCKRAAWAQTAPKTAAAKSLPPKKCAANPPPADNPFYKRAFQDAARAGASGTGRAKMSQNVPPKTARTRKKSANLRGTQWNRFRN